MVPRIRQVGESGCKVGKWNIHKCSFDIVATALRGKITRLAYNVLLPVFLSGVFSVVFQLMPFDHDLLYQFHSDDAAILRLILSHGRVKRYSRFFRRSYVQH